MKPAAEAAAAGRPKLLRSGGPGASWDRSWPRGGHGLRRVPERVEAVAGQGAGGHPEERQRPVVAVRMPGRLCQEDGKATKAREAA